VEHESPSKDKSRLDECARFLAERCSTLIGGNVEMHPAGTNGNHLLVRKSGRGAGPQVLLLAHYDTVWPAGTLAAMPFTLDGVLVKGPGVFDMKAGLVQGLWALRAVFDNYPDLPGRVTFLLNSDEEVGSPSSAELIRQESAEAAAVLVLEPSLDGALKTSRKGWGLFELDVAGVSAHAGLDPSAGASALEELAKQILVLHGMTDPDAGTFVNVGTARGGTRPNVTAAHAYAEIDLRVSTLKEAESAVQRILGLQPYDPRVALTVRGGMNRPPMERTEAIAYLFARARSIGRRLDLELGEATVGSVSDGNIAASMGAAVLDGLGPVGGGAHAVDEHVDIRAMPVRAALVAELLKELLLNPNDSSSADPSMRSVAEGGEERSRIARLGEEADRAECSRGTE
jgi:glutamate carboxypeptidase